MFTFIIGGSASGKSEYAERHVLSLQGQRVYIATLEPWDEECRARIRKHQNTRAERGFMTLECYRGLDRLAVPEGSNILLDGLGNLVAGELYHPDGRGTAAILAGVEHLLTQCSHLTIVADEVFSGGTDYEGDTLHYLREMGRLHCDLARRADRVVEIVCGIPNVLKELPASAGSIPLHEFEIPGTHTASATRESRAPVQAAMTPHVHKETAI